MLRDYIEAYIEAEKNRDRKEMKRIENEMRKLGVDRITFALMVTEVKEELR